MKLGALLRNIFIVAVAFLVSFLFIVELMRIQIADGEYYASQSVQLLEATQEIEASRGQIADRNGNILTTNQTIYKVIVQKAFFTSGSENSIISRTLTILSNCGEEWIDSVPITMNRPFRFKEDASDEELDSFKVRIGVNVDATVENCLDALYEEYRLDESSYSEEMKRCIAGVRYEMKRMDFSFANRYILAEDIDISTVIKLKEQSFMLSGIDIVEEPQRVYLRSDIAPHVLGVVKPIDEEIYEAKKEAGEDYDLNDTIGEFGIELAAEDLLRGDDGVRTIVRSSSGEVVSDEITRQVDPGDSIKLTIDADFQEDLQTILENQIKWLHYYNDPNRGNECDSGAVVVLDAKTGAVLGMASYPTYDLNTYLKDYNSIIEQSTENNSPSALVNRAINGLYRPGSAFKTINAIAGLSEGLIEEDTPGECSGTYTYYSDYQPKCTGFHYGYNVKDSLKVSCNIFFYDLGRRLGIDTLSDYARMFGYGTDLGLEIGGSTGRMSTPETYENVTGVEWTAGNVLQAAIGQCETQVTPLHLAVQAMTLANDGVRYRPYLIDSVWNYDYTELISKTEPEIVQVIDDNGKDSFEIVREGMISVSTFATWPLSASTWTFDYLPYSVAIKTGTAEEDNIGKYYTSTVMGYYPAEDPQIAFGICLQKGEFSRYMIRNIIDAYFYDCYEPDVDEEGNIISPWKRWEGERTPVR